MYAVINGTWARFLERLNGPPAKPPHLNGKVETQALIDQPFMRSVVNDLAVPDDRFVPRKAASEWAVVPGLAGATYPRGVACALGEAAACERVAAERRKTAFLVQSVRPQVGRDGTAPSLQRSLRIEHVALAPDWLFGRGCLTHLRAPKELFRLSRANGHGGGDAAPGASDAAECRAAPTTPGRAPLAPGPAAGLLVGTHFVYSMALKRKRAFRAFGWDLGDTRNRTAPSLGGGGASCLERAERGILFGHTFFDQTSGLKSIVCSSLPDEAAPACSCCVGLDSMVAKDKGSRGSYRLETTGGYGFSSPNHFKSLEGCNDYQLFWD